MTPPDDLPSPKGLACDSLLKRANEATGLRAAGALVPELLAALESDRAKLVEVTAQRDSLDHEYAAHKALCVSTEMLLDMQEEADVAETKSAADRALLRRIVEAWDAAFRVAPLDSALRFALNEARARIGEGK